MIKFFLLVILATLSSAHGAAPPAIQVIPQQECVLDHLADENLCQLPTNTRERSARKTGVAWVNRAVGEALQQSAGVNPYTSTVLSSKGSKIPAVCSVLTKTTQRHVDTLRELPHVSEAEKLPKGIPHAKTAFLFLNSNPKASFQYGDQSFPVERGNLVVLDGRVPHHTLIPDDGTTVELLGPLDPTTFRLVGADIVDSISEGFDEAVDLAGISDGDSLIPDLEEISDVNSLIPDLSGLIPDFGLTPTDTDTDTTTPPLAELQPLLFPLVIIAFAAIAFGVILGFFVVA